MRKRLLIVAAKAPQPGRVKTRLISDLLSPGHSARLATAFLQDTLALAQHPALRAECWLALDGDLRWVPEAARQIPCIPQAGNDLGERLTDIFSKGFEAGFSAVCVIGSDTPHLPVAVVQEAFGRLEAGTQAVFGPSEDGGYYLVGLRQPQPELFAGIPWSTEATLARSLEAAAEHQLSARLLPPWFDIDLPSDLIRLRRDLRRGVAFAPATGETLAAPGAMYT